MTKREYNKYHRDDIKDTYGNIIKPGDLVCVNEPYYSRVFVGKVEHFTETDRIKVQPLEIPNNYRWHRYANPNWVVKIDIDFFNNYIKDE